MPMFIWGKLRRPPSSSPVFSGTGPLDRSPNKNRNGTFGKRGKEEIPFQLFFFIFFEPRSFASQLAIHAARFECKLRRSKWFHNSLPLGSGHSKIAGDCVCGSKHHTLRKMCKMKWRCFTKNRQNLNVSTYVIQVFFVVVGLRFGLHTAVGWGAPHSACAHLGPRCNRRFASMLQTSDVAEGSRKCDHVSNICGTMLYRLIQVQGVTSLGTCRIACTSFVIHFAGLRAFQMFWGRSCFG